MIKKYLLVISAMLALALPVSAYEQTASTTLREKMQERMDQAHQRMETRKEELKDKLAAIRDQRKAQIAERVQTNLSKLNERMVNHFTKLLDKLEEILERIQKRADKAAERGLDVSAVNAAIEKAHDAIADARAAITGQADNTYPVEATDDEHLRADVAKARKALNDDLKKVFRAVKAAREAVHAAATALAHIPRGDHKTASSTSSENEHE